MRPARRIAWPFVALAAFGSVALLHAAGWISSIENDAADARARLLRHEVPSRIVIVGIDARSLAQMPEWPWPRRHHARLLEQLAHARPARVFLDIDFSAAREPEDDARLESALADWSGRPVLLPAFLQPASGTDSELMLTRPLDRFARHVELASVNLQPGNDGLVRAVRSSWRFGSQTFPGVFTAGRDGVPAGEHHAIDFSISPSSFSFFSYVDVVNGRVPDAELRGKTVYVGATALELGDVLSVPVYRSLPGIAVLALATETMEQGVLVSPPSWLLMLALGAWAMLWATAFESATWRRNLVSMAGCLVLVAAVGVYAYAAHRVALEIVPFALVAACAFLIVTVRSLDEQTLRALAHALGIRRRDALLRSIVESSSDCIVCIDDQGRIQTSNAAAARLFECEPGALSRLPIGGLLPALEGADARTVAEALEALSGLLTESEARTVAGRAFPVDLSISRVRLKDERLYTAIARDISDRKAQQRELEYQATHDPLTALPNRTALAAHLERLLAEVPADQCVALLLLDLCRFKEVNDTLGHNVGDSVLREVAQRFRATVGERGLVARIGGDEFTVVVDRAAGNGAVESIAVQLQACLEAPIDAGEIAIAIGLSIGIARFPLDAPDALTLLKHADIAMYDAKRRGSAFEHYDATHDEHSVRKLMMAGELRSAIATGQLHLYYQPQVDLRSGRVTSAEALLRWEHPVLGRVSPAEFIGIAETSDLIQPLTEWTLREALSQLARWKQAGLELRVAVNLSARLLQDTGFPARLRALLEQGGVAPRSLELEITESAMMLDPERALRIVKDLHALGVLIAVDDYGTGFSSLGYLRDLPVHALKLDKSFVMNMRSRADDRIIVESTVQMAHALKLAVVAEGVESDWDARFLASIGYDYAQGYCYSAALPAGEFPDWVRRFNAAAA